MFHTILVSIQITLTGFFIYRIQRFLRVHKTWEVLLWSAALSIFMIITLTDAVTANFKTVVIVSVAVFSAIMALEPEIANLWNRLILNLSPNSLHKHNQVLKEIADAANALAATKTGALIAFERNDSLLPFGDTGIEINADIKKELLTTLFFKDTPTHDGGLLIREGKATHCGAVFPLTAQKQLNGLGTRHRAALGLTEKTDAICLVVSEEEGTVSLAKNGELFYDIPREFVEAKLKETLSGKTRSHYYPLHYIKQLSPKLVQSNFVQFSKSPSLKLYDLNISFFWFCLVLFLDSNLIITLQDYRQPFDLLVTKTWVLAPAVLFALNLLLFFVQQKISINGVMSEVNMEKRFLFIPLIGKKLLRENLKAVLLKKERLENNLCSLSFLNNKKNKIYVLDRSTSHRSLADYARKIKDVLKIDLVS